MKLLFLLSSIIFATSCAHNIKKGLAEVQPGMTRPDVVDVAGSPVYVNRKTENHVWVYRYYDNKDKIWVKKAVYFQNDVVAKVDDAPKRDVILKSPYPETAADSLEKDNKPLGAIKKAPGVGSEDWYQEIKTLQESEVEKERKKTVPEFEPVK